MEHLKKFSAHASRILAGLPWFLVPRFTTHEYAKFLAGRFNRGPLADSPAARRYRVALQYPLEGWSNAEVCRAIILRPLLPISDTRPIAEMLSDKNISRKNRSLYMVTRGTHLPGVRSRPRTPRHLIWAAIIAGDTPLIRIGFMKADVGTRERIIRALIERRNYQAIDWILVTFEDARTRLSSVCICSLSNWWASPPVDVAENTTFYIPSSGYLISIATTIKQVLNLVNINRHITDILEEIPGEIPVAELDRRLWEFPTLKGRYMDMIQGAETLLPLPDFYHDCRGFKNIRWVENIDWRTPVDIYHLASRFTYHMDELTPRVARIVVGAHNIRTNNYVNWMRLFILYAESLDTNTPRTRSLTARARLLCDFAAAL